MDATNYISPSPHTCVDFGYSNAPGAARPYRANLTLGADNPQVSARGFDPHSRIGVYACQQLATFPAADDPASAAAATEGIAAASTAAEAARTDLLSRRAAAKAEFTQLSARYLAADDSYSLGFHMHPFSKQPLRLWAVGSLDSRWFGGVEVAPRRGMDARSVRMAMSFATKPAFEASVAIDGMNQEFVAGFVHQMTLRRNVYNPFEASHVKGIWTYLDLGIEMRKPLALSHSTVGGAAGDGPPADFTVGAAWQANKGLIFKGKVGTRESGFGVAVRSWWDPVVTLSASYASVRGKDDARVGVCLSVVRGGLPAVYVKPRFDQRLTGKPQTYETLGTSRRDGTGARDTPVRPKDDVWADGTRRAPRPQAPSSPPSKFL